MNKRKPFPDSNRGLPPQEGRLTATSFNMTQVAFNFDSWIVEHALGEIKDAMYEYNLTTRDVLNAKSKRFLEFMGRLALENAHIIPIIKAAITKIQASLSARGYSCSVHFGFASHSKIETKTTMTTRPSTTQREQDIIDQIQSKLDSLKQSEERLQRMYADIVQQKNAKINHICGIKKQDFQIKIWLQMGLILNGF